MAARIELAAIREHPSRDPEIRVVVAPEDAEIPVELVDRIRLSPSSGAYLVPHEVGELLVLGTPPNPRVVYRLGDAAPGVRVVPAERIV